MKSQIDNRAQPESKVIIPPGICHQGGAGVIGRNKPWPLYRSITDDDTFLGRFGEDRHWENSHHFTDTTM